MLPILAKMPFNPSPCSPNFKVQNEDETLETANATDLISFMNGVVNYITAFNPGAIWWQNEKSIIGFPLARFKTLNEIKTGSGILPTETHALGIGLISMAYRALSSRHLIYLDEEKKRVNSNSPRVSGIRISEEATDTNNSVVHTRIGAVIEMTEGVFKFGYYLNRTKTWKIDSDEKYHRGISREPDMERRDQLERDYRGFISGMYGDESVLNDLTAVGDGAITNAIDGMKLVTSLLALSFAKKDSSGHIGCFTENILNPVSGIESFRGECNEKEQAAWKYSLRLAGRSLGSSKFLEIANSP